MRIRCITIHAGMTLLLALPLLAGGPRERRNINDGWLFHKGENANGFQQSLDLSGWHEVALPHTWNVHDSFDQRGVDDGLDITLSYYRGPSWYRKTVFLEQEDSSRRIHLQFEGANKVSEVYVNEQHVGTHTGGYTGFEFDITPQVKFGADNLIAVRVNNAYHYDIPPQSADYTMYGGIYRDVWLTKTAPVHLTRVLISTPEVSAEKASVRFEVFLKNSAVSDFAGSVEIAVLDPEGQTVATIRRNVTLAASAAYDVSIENHEIAQPKLWSPDAPHLYTARVNLLAGDRLLDAMTERFGLRWFRFDADEGFFLNGSYLRLQGVNRHQDRAGYGNALSDELHVEDMLLIKKVGANFVRLAHYPQDPAVLNACDSLGLLVWEEIPVVRSVGKQKFADNAKQMLREMIIQHYNHPSIIIWGLMNEVMRDQRDKELHWAVDLCRELHALAKALDPARYTAQAQFKDRGTDVLTITDIIGFNKYFGWYSDEFSTFGQHMDEQKQLYPDKIFIISEYGAGSKRGYHIEKPTAPDFSESWQLDLHQSYWKQITERKFIAGSAIWNMFDFASDEKGGNIPHINQKGLMTFDRQPKDVFYYYQCQWKDEPLVYIVSHTWRKRSGKPGESKQVEVLSNCEQVELFVNGKSAGTESAGSFTWDVTFKQGINYLKAVGRQGTNVVEDEISLSNIFE